MSKLPDTLHKTLLEIENIKSIDAYAISYSAIKELVNNRFVMIKFAGGWVLTDKAKDYIKAFS